MSKQAQLLAGLDIGSTHVSAVICSIAEGGQVQVVGQGDVTGQGVKHGSVVEVERTISLIRTAVELAEASAGTRAPPFQTVVSGVHATVMQSTGAVRIKGRAVSRDDVRGAVDVVRARAIPADHRLIQTLLRYQVDGRTSTLTPEGLVGLRLDATGTIVTAHVGALDTLERCVREAGASVSSFVLQPLAAAAAVLSNDDRANGACVIDIGFRTAEFVVFQDGAVTLKGSVAMGGLHMSQAIMQALRLGGVEAERIKRESGTALAARAEPGVVQVEPTAAQPQRTSIALRTVAEVLEPQAETLLRLVARDLEAASIPLAELSGGVVLTGGGSLLGGMVELTEDVLGVIARRGTPLVATGPGVTALDGRHAAVVGAALYGAMNDPLTLEQRPTRSKIARVMGFFGFSDSHTLSSSS